MASVDAAAATANAGDGEIKPHAYYRHLNQHRFSVELEFLSSLASPAYITYLHNQGHLTDSAFIRYLAYLYTTWSQPRYVRFLRFPNALIFCRALAQSPAFRAVVGQDGWEETVTKEVLAHWTSGNGRAIANTDDGQVDDGADKDANDRTLATAGSKG